MSLRSAILINGTLDLGVILAVAAIMRAPFTFDRPKDEAAVYSFATDLPEDLAA